MSIGGYCLTCSDTLFIIPSSVGNCPSDVGSIFYEKP
nr:MAG TPA: hypothetical protein [Caudoviricetes sp.]DAH18921.1 MAG TPA: hypothetical protein [Caudoviricetes sp.]